MVLYITELKYLTKIASVKWNINSNLLVGMVTTESAIFAPFPSAKFQIYFYYIFMIPFVSFCNLINFNSTHFRSGKINEINDIMQLSEIWNA